jgi:SAM-dependent methyltransferase
MGSDRNVPLLYTELAEWWPLISPPDEYRDEADSVIRVLGECALPVRTVLELGSGGGHNAVHLARRFEMTLVDLSPAMLAMSGRLNPNCEHVLGDMRTVRLERLFDAVFIHDAIGYMLDADDLGRALATAFVHCRPGGMVLIEPDHVEESFQPSTDHGGQDGTDGRAARYLEWVHPAQGNEVVVDYVFALAEDGQAPRVVHDRHVCGLFPTSMWMALLERAGFDAEIRLEETNGDYPSRLIFVGRRPQG